MKKVVKIFPAFLIAVLIGIIFVPIFWPSNASAASCCICIISDQDGATGETCEQGLSEDDCQALNEEDDKECSLEDCSNDACPSEPAPEPVIEQYQPIGGKIEQKDENIYFTPSITVPGSEIFKNTNKIKVSNQLLGIYISDLYRFSVGLAGILAVLMIAYGGVVWTFSGGEASKITKAREIILGAVTGLVLALGSYLILNTINPKLVKTNLFVPPVVDPGLPDSTVKFCDTSYDPKITSTRAGCGYEDKEQKCAFYATPVFLNNSANEGGICNVERNTLSTGLRNYLSIGSIQFSYDFWGYLTNNNTFRGREGKISLSRVVATGKYIVGECGDIFISSSVGNFVSTSCLGDQYCVVSASGGAEKLVPEVFVEEGKVTRIGKLKTARCLP